MNMSVIDVQHTVVYVNKISFTLNSIDSLIWHEILVISPRRGLPNSASFSSSSFVIFVSFPFPLPSCRETKVGNMYYFSLGYNSPTVSVIPILLLQFRLHEGSTLAAPKVTCTALAATSIRILLPFTTQEIGEYLANIYQTSKSSRKWVH